MTKIKMDPIALLSAIKEHSIGYMENKYNACIVFVFHVADQMLFDGREQSNWISLDLGHEVLPYLKLALEVFVALPIDECISLPLVVWLIAFLWM